MTDNPDRRAAPDSPAPIPEQVRHTRLGGVWLLLVAGAVVLVLLLVFILMNSQRVQMNFYGAHVTAPLGVALLLAAALGVLLVVVPGGGRIIQLKRAAKRLHQEREHLAGRLGEVTDATGDAPGTQPATHAPGDAGTATAPTPGQPSARQPYPGQEQRGGQQQQQGWQPPQQ